MSDDDWDVDETVAPAAPAVALPPKVTAKKWADEDAEDNDNDDDWDKSDDEKPQATKTATVAPAKKKGTLKQKLAEKEKLAREAKAKGVDDDDDLMYTMTEQERRRLAREKEQEADLAVASELMGAVDLGDEGDALKSVLSARPSTKNDFAELSKNIYTSIIKKHESNPLYSQFVEQLAKDISTALTAVQTRKVSSALSVLGNTKQQEERDKASGKKKPASKPKLGGIKVSSKVDTEAYDDVLGDDDFM
ncbi:translation initiation factor 3 subunit J [Cryptococcus bacillisporus CA1873]|uniref:Eukaryotic translation initiation factor 3 subunit J n=1 Tax=Cryptococcus bacillisporus CA1873 TaxID=1296111 RepID=A0ABR5B5K5_CRYGA|nr:translation initiation factor 3 subunit J [Cryptococcus bacillisporus CA1873]|eukprot:KIR58872.1 translation initiation factor 3 subunit J [Cryptococcus gattii CA1873]